jgi:ABC-type uncharacterized transport system auxiliary subunit
VLYVLSVPPPPAAGDVADGATVSEAATASLEVIPFGAAPGLESERLLVRESPNRVGRYAYHRFAGEPAALVSEATARWLRATGSFRDVAYPGDGHGDYVLRGRLLRFEQTESNGRWGGAVEISFELRGALRGGRVWSQVISHENEAASRHPEAVVGALSEALAAVLVDARASMLEAIASEANATRSDPPTTTPSR